MTTFSSYNYKPFILGSKVKFTKHAKYEYDFKKGDEATIVRVISPFPSATDTIYLVVHKESMELMWVTGKDVVPFEQLSLLSDARIPLYGYGFATPVERSKGRCESTMSEYACCLWEGHGGKHVAYAGWEWSEKNSDRNQGIKCIPGIFDE